MKANVEILAPAGSWESMTAGIEAGADAVYMGGSRFGARAYAENPEADRFLEAIDYAHLHESNIYMTVNTLVKDGELNDLFPYLKPCYEQGVDGVIVQDLGVFALIRKNFPDLPIHASTQMTITGYHGAKLLKEMGASRIVTARELSLGEIQKIRDHVDIEIESFVHGALCYCYSGQCLMSSFIGGRSGNRGRCAQPCRLPYDVRQDGALIGKSNERYVMSLKDLCTLDLLPDIIEAGVSSLKIEGRMKSPRYTAGVVSTYRKYVDRYENHGRKGYQVDAKDRAMLLELFDRGGFSEGYYEHQNNRTMIALQEKPEFRKGNQELYARLDETYVEKKAQKPICGVVTLKEGKEAHLKLWKESKDGKKTTIEVTGVVVQSAQNQPLTEDKLKKQMLKMGNTPFMVRSMEVEMEGACFLPVQAINDLRRVGVESLTEALLKPYRRESSIVKMQMGVSLIQSGESAPLRLHASLEDPWGFQEVVRHSNISSVYLDSTGFEPKEWKKYVMLCHNAGKTCSLILPHIFRTEAEVYFDKYVAELEEAGFDELVIRSIEEVNYLREKKNAIPLLFDYGLYTMNGLAAYSMIELGAVRQTLPLELNSRELENLGCWGREMIGYGFLPAMVSAQCIKKTVSGCNKKPGLVMMKDRMGKELPVKNHCRFCYNTVYNPSPLSLLGQEQLIKRLNPATLRLQFTTETPEQIKRVMDAYADHFLHEKDTPVPFNDFTRGHLKRGVE